jgi:hypothetical protein
VVGDENESLASSIQRPKSAPAGSIANFVATTSSSIANTSTVNSKPNATNSTGAVTKSTTATTSVSNTNKGSAVSTSPVPALSTSDLKRPTNSSDDDILMRGSTTPQRETKHETEVSDDIHMSASELQQVVLEFRQHSLSEFSAKKMKQLQVRMSAGLEDQGHRTLEGSRILVKNSDELLNVYYSLPFFARAPLLRMIYSTALHQRSLEELYVRTMKVRFFEMFAVTHF